ncbi:SDR family oxidoreductase [Salipiger sp. 1_MG-2023]|uniref:SDR family oxidoreductase n=1 Tax=Salipiger sp. 1_MG-2023 TaxID=3062665 RepID=UPI0026E1635B|nr:SDR family oxidoreductase [Salipiger sp. 1_MG-2023]MDO6588188.1 SDR family oxidoreductase [Salipiger sp. 1_MG-2023]
MRILITGANRGIGAALAAELSARGNDVTGTARNMAGLAPLDVTDPDSIASLAKSIDAPLDALICNAGVYLDKGQSIDGYPQQMWADSFAVNVTGVFLTVQAMLPLLKQAQTPKIMIISSQMASDTRAPGGSYIYRASKAAALNLGRNLATDLALQGVAVGIYHPGWVQTDMGGGAADITPQQSASGLADRLSALSLASTGCFECWDGRPHPF